tara:strand:+ start:234 stop:608 length:375 start_codon:yes stop_codon:yes gene_type:complete
MKKSKIYLTDENIKKIEIIAKEKYKNPNYKKASVIRNIIDEADFDNMFFSDGEFQLFTNKFLALNDLGSKLNSMVYDLNIEHLKHMKGEENNYVLMADEFTPLIEEIKVEIIKLKEEISKFSKK